MLWSCRMCDVDGKTLEQGVGGMGMMFGMENDSPLQTC